VKDTFTIHRLPPILHSKEHSRRDKYKAALLKIFQFASAAALTLTANEQFQIFTKEHNSRCGVMNRNIKYFPSS
jgi:hypothetical protein